MKKSITCPYCSATHQTAAQDRSCLNEMLQRSRFAEYRYFFHDANHPLARTGVGKRGLGLVDPAAHLVSVHRGSWLEAGEIVRFDDGDVKNFSSENLQVVSRSTLSMIAAHSPRLSKNCVVCNTPIPVSLSHFARRTTCSVECRAIMQQHFEVTAGELLLMVWEYSTVKVGKFSGVSDKTVEKRCIKLGVPKPPRGYWALIRVGATHDRALIRLGWTYEQIKTLDQKFAEAESQ